MAEKIFTEAFCEIQKKSVCTTTEELNFDNFTECGTYHIFEDMGNGRSCTYYLVVDKSEDNGCTTQTRLHCGCLEYRGQNADGTWTEWTSQNIPVNVDLEELEARPTYGGEITEFTDLRSDVKAGTYRIVSGRVSNAAVYSGGFAQELFTFDANYGELTADTMLFDPPAECIIPTDSETNSGVVAFYDRDGNYVGKMEVEPTTLPAYMLDTSKLGATTQADYVDFFMWVYEPGVTIPSSITIYQNSTLVLFDGVNNIFYENKWNTDQELNAKANAEDVYSKEAADKKFAEKANAGVVVATEEELPDDASVGVIHHVLEQKTFSYDYKLVTGKFSDLFNVLADGVYELSIRAVDADYVMETDSGITYTYVYNADDGSFVGRGDISTASAIDVTRLHGWDGTDDCEVSFYICAYNDLVITTIPEQAMYWNGTEWVDVALGADIGKIDEALDAILAMDDAILGGVS